MCVYVCVHFQTEGAGSFSAAKSHGSPVSLKEIKTVATSLGALQVSEGVPGSLSVRVCERERDLVYLSLFLLRAAHCCRERRIADASLSMTLN